MTYELIIGDRAYSSWSLRGWLLFEKFGIKASTKLITFLTKNTAEQLADFAPARTVPAVRFPDNSIVADSLAIAEELATRHPEAGLWPSDSAARAFARGLAAEMHSSFFELRGDCPMNLRVAYQDFPASVGVRADIARIDEIWGQAFDRFGGDWLCGEYSVADAFFAPVAARIAGYGLNVGERGSAYVTRHLSDPAFRRWRAMGLAKGPDLPWYAKDFAQTSWPGPSPMPAAAVDEGVPENTVCPYSSKPVTHLLKLNGRIFGFCNSFCRDKTLADPEAWPAFMEIYQS